MSVQALANRYRPQSFDDLVGQQATVQTLKNALTQHAQHHAYLFSGTRGVGKTTLARLMAKCFNCEKGVSPTPCQTCSSCQEITAGRHMDLIEIDAASRTKVEDTRELLDNVPYAASHGRFKIYLIDEVHMLSKHSFNALLKTLEEPPPHVKFILATTDPEKIPATVRSRCLHFELTHLSENDITDRLLTITQKENIKVEAGSLAPIAKAAHGSMRDALSLLDRMIAFGNGHIELAKVQEALGMDREEQMLELLRSLSAADYPAMQSQCDRMATHNVNFAKVLENLCHWWHRLASAQMLTRLGADDPCANPDVNELSSLFDPASIQLNYQICVQTLKDLEWSPTPQIAFEMALIRMMAFTPVDADDTAPPHKASAPKTQSQEAASKPKETRRPTLPNVGNSPNDRWVALSHQLKLRGISQQIVNHCVCREWTEDQLSLVVDQKHGPLLSPQQIQKIQDAIRSKTHKNINVSIDKGTIENHETTPMDQITQAKQAVVNKMVDRMDEHPAVNQLMESMGASLVPDSIEVYNDQVINEEEN